MGTVLTSVYRLNPNVHHPIALIQNDRLRDLKLSSHRNESIGAGRKGCSNDRLGGSGRLRDGGLHGVRFINGVVRSLNDWGPRSLMICEGLLLNNIDILHECLVSDRGILGVLTHPFLKVIFDEYHIVCLVAFSDRVSYLIFSRREIRMVSESSIR